MNSMMFIPSTTRLEAVQPLPDAGGTALPCDIAGRSRVLRNSHALLSMALLFSGAIAAASGAYRLPAPGVLLTLGGCFGLLFAVYKFKMFTRLLSLFGFGSANE